MLKSAPKTHFLRQNIGENRSFSLSDRRQELRQIRANRN